MRTGQCWDQRLAAAGTSPLGSLPCGGQAGPQHPLPRCPPRITHGALIHHAQHPPCRGFPAPTHSATSSRAPSQRLRAISKFPGAERAALPRSSPRQSIPGTSRCCKHCPTTLQHAARAGAAGRLSKRGLRAPQMGQPHPEPRPDTHTPLCLQEPPARRGGQGTDVTRWARGAL